MRPEPANNRKLVGNSRLLGKQLANVEAGNIGFDRIKLAAILGGSVGLEVVHVDMARAARQVDHDDRLLPKLPRVSPLGSQTKQVGQRQTAEAERANTQEFSPRVTAAGVSLGSKQVEHGVDSGLYLPGYESLMFPRSPSSSTEVMPSQGTCILANQAVRVCLSGASMTQKIFPSERLQKLR